MGACLDLLRQAAATLAMEANGVSDNPADLRGDAARRFRAATSTPSRSRSPRTCIAIAPVRDRVDRGATDRRARRPDVSGLPAFLTPKPGLNSGFMIPQVTAAALVAENKQRAYPASVDSIPTSANQEDHVSMAAHAARRLLPMAENAAPSSPSSCWPRRRAATSMRRWRPARRSNGCARGPRVSSRPWTTTATSRRTSRRPRSRPLRGAGRRGRSGPVPEALRSPTP